MKKLCLSLVALLLAATATKAEDGFSVNALTVPQGGSAELEIVFESETAIYNRFQLEVKMPEGITYVQDTEGDVICSKGALIASTDHGISASHIVSQGLERFICYSSNNRKIPAGKGVIMTVTYQADASLAVGTVLTGHVQNVLWNDVDNAEYTTTDIPFTITIGEPDDGRIKFDETKTTLPTYTAGEKGNVTMKRTIKAGEWSTLVLPFNLTKKAATDIFGSDVQMAMFSGFEVDYGDDEENITPLGIQLNFTAYTIPAKGNLAGGTPILIKTSQNIETIEVDNCTLVGAVTNVTVKDEYETSGKFTGTFVKTTVPEDGLFISGNEFWYSVGLTNIKAFRCWFELGAVLGKDTDFGANIRYTVYDEATGIKEMVNVKGQKDAAEGWFTVDGRKLSGKPTEKGVYIFNNKKVAIQ